MGDERDRVTEVTIDGVDGSGELEWLRVKLGRLRRSREAAAHRLTLATAVSVARP